MLRGILGALAGVIIGTVVILLIEMLGHFVYPLPANVDPKDHQALAEFMKTAPPAPWLFVLAAYAAGSFAGGAAGARIGKKPWAGWLTGGLLMALGLVGLLTMWHPAWFWVVSLSLYLPAAWAGARLVRRAPPVHS
jgi:hypothetical protein